jgi:peptide/nickel transport system substrate-binding protein
VKQLLSEAGFPNGFDVTINAPDGRYVRDKEVVEAVAKQLGKAGIRAQVKVHQWGSYVNNMFGAHKAGPMALIGWATGTYDAEGVYVPLFRSGRILSNYFNPAFDELVEEAQKAMDPAKRLQMYRRLSQILVDDAAVMPLYQQLDLYGVSRDVVWVPRGDERIKAFNIGGAR